MEHLRLEKYRWDAENCCGCKGCIWVDPVYVRGKAWAVRCPSLLRFRFDSYSALGRLKLAVGLMDGEIQLTDTALDIIYKCNLCGACDVGCKRNLDLEPLLALEALRILAVEQGTGPPRALTQIAENIAATGNRYGIDPRGRSEWIPQSANAKAEAPVAFFAGCNISYKNPALAECAISLLDALDVAYCLFPEESCCGHPFTVAGMAHSAIDVAKTNIAKLAQTGATTILTICAECYKTWKVDYPKLLGKSTSEMGYEVMHIVELLWQLLRHGDFMARRPLRLRVAYHDPCNLGRLSEAWVHWSGTRGPCGITKPPKYYRRGDKGIYQEPRMLISMISGIDLKEFPRARENALCCGAGGGVLEAYPDFGMFTARQRLQEAAAMGVEAIVSACPYCRDMLSSAARVSNPSIKVYDIVELMSASLLDKELPS